jgi:phosphoribosylanthranilate isomerase
MQARLKVCCISSPDEVRAAVEAGAHALGLVASMPSGPGVIADELIATLARLVPPGVSSFLLTSRTQGEAIADHAHAAGVDTIQIVDQVATSEYATIRRRLPALRVVQVIHVQDESAFDEARRVSEYVDAVLLDSGRPKPSAGEVRTLGGTGKTHNWEISRRIVDAIGRPVFLAGGLSATNVRQAIDAVRPFGIDLCTGVRTGGRLDAGKLRELVRAMS